MITPVFGKEYADQYDILYGEKNYEAECDMLEQVFQRYGDDAILSLLDLGCGTGNHAFPLARRGYEVTGVDYSPDMLMHAQQKAATILLSPGYQLPAFLQDDVRTMDLGRQFDVVLMMFAVLGYQLTNDDMLAALHTVRRHLRPGGLFVCDFWYGPAVLNIRPTDRVKVIPVLEGKLIRTATGKIDIRHQLCAVGYHLWRLNGDRLISESEEVHRVRFFFPLELDLALAQAGLVLQSLTAFSDLDHPADDTTWNVLAVAKTGEANGGQDSTNR